MDFAAPVGSIVWIARMACLAPLAVELATEKFWKETRYARPVDCRPLGI
jgi:hypothetical protein